MLFIKSWREQLGWKDNKKRLNFQICHAHHNSIASRDWAHGRKRNEWANTEVISRGEPVRVHPSGDARMVLVDTKSFLFGHGTLKISLQTENHLNGWLSVVIHLWTICWCFDRQPRCRGRTVDASPERWWFYTAETDNTSSRMGAAAWTPGYMWKAYMESNHKWVAKGKISQRRPGLWLVKARQVYISKDSACSREIYMQGPQSISLIDG